MILEIISINLSRNKKIIFKNFCLKIFSSEIITLIGRNGSGKTSLLEMITGLLKPESGVIRINKINIEEIGERKRDQFIYIPYEDALKENLTINENLQIWANLASIDLSEKLFEKSLNYFSLSKIKHVLVSKLSQGQKKKIALTKLLLTNCSLWILDEPFNSLDKESIEILKKLFLSHKKNGGVVLFASHIDIKIRGKINIFLKPPKTPLVKTNKIDHWEALR
ncbi:MAG: heme ABC exporter ATP-binding protein CcmA [Alphaproteobacteria bacterium]